ncbi:hypothetical protein [uncultured Clostridium sp.]|mgnify:CR=1 FL=1|jgi:hypothetical protein|uniref:hypothetical protein n=1 Tax=uncultured Clostridium sp. TaxID=59620 RepID=UPI002612F5B7|nr:hypothetical protein [uncultured Clostridium sp.]
MKLKVREPAPEVEEPIEVYEEVQEGDVEEAPPSLPSSPKKKDKWITFMKVIVLFCLCNGIAWVWCSYILAWQGKEQIAESLSQVALTEIIAVVVVYAAKSVFENLSKNNSWPDKPGADSDPPDGVG